MIEIKKEIERFLVDNDIAQGINFKEEKESLKRVYTAPKGFKIGKSGCCLNPTEAYNKLGLVSIDIDIDNIYGSDCRLGYLLEMLEQEEICFAVSKPNRVRIYLKNFNEVINLKKTYYYDENGFSGKIEILGLLNHHCDYAMNSDIDNKYYELYNIDYVLEDFNKGDFVDNFSILLDSLKSDTVKNVDENGSVDRYLSKEQRSYEDDVKQALFLKKYDKLYERTVQRRGDEAVFKSGNRNDPIFHIYLPMFENNPYISYEDWCGFLDYIETVDPGFDRDNISWNERRINKFIEKEVLDMPEITNKNEKANNNKYRGFMSMSYNGSFKRFVIEEDKINGGYSIYRPKSDTDSKALFGDISYTNTIIEVYDCDNSRISDIIYEENGKTYFNHTANTVAQLKIRNDWLKNKHIYDNVDLNINTYRVFKNIFDKNTDLFLKKEAIVLATLKKLKFLDIIGTEARSSGKSSIVRLLSKTRLPEHLWKDSKDYIAGRPETDGKKVKFAGSIHNNCVSMHLDEDGMDRATFEFIKAVQSPFGVDAPKKGVDSFNINPAYINAYYTFNMSGDVSNIYYSKKDASYVTTVCLTANKKALAIDDPNLDIDIDFLNSKEAIYNLSKYLLKLYTSMSKDEINNIIQNYPKLSNYKLEDYLEETDRNKTESIIDEYVEAIKSLNKDNIDEFLNDSTFYNYMNRSKVNNDVINKVKDYLNKIDSNIESNFTYGIHKAICSILNIDTRKINLAKYFSGKSERSILKSALTVMEKEI